MDEQHGQAAAAHAAALRAEYRWAMLTGAVIVFLLVMMGYTTLHWVAMPALRTETVDPSTLHIAGEFTEDKLGSALEADGSVTVRVAANQYSFNPSCIVVPVATPVLIRGTSADVVHGFSVAHTNVNMMLVPGYVGNLNARFHKTGDFLMPCHEYCGSGHAAMWAHVQVIERNDFLERARGGRRVNCAGR